MVVRNRRVPVQAGQEPLFLPETDWRPPRMEDLPDWAGAKRVGFDVETRDETLHAVGPGWNRPGCYAVGFSFAIEDGPRHYLPIRHEGGDNLDAAAVLRYLRDQCAAFEGDLVGANLPYDLLFSEAEGIPFVSRRRARRFLDVQVADALIDELRDSYTLEAICGRHGLPGKNEALLREAAAAYGLQKPREVKGGMWRLPGRYVGAYGEDDAWLPLEVLRRQERQIDDQDLWQVFGLETDVLPILVKMTMRGVAVDLDQLARVETYVAEREAAHLDEVHRATGWRVAPDDVWKADALAEALSRIGVTVPKTAQGKPSVTKHLLEQIEHPVAEALSRARAYDKIRTTFVSSVRTHLVDGRIHPHYNQLRNSGEDDGDETDDLQGAAYGRLSSNHPNIQQQPARDPELGPMWRKIYVPDRGVWGALDFSQQEPRMTIHFACLLGLPKAEEAARRYREDPNADNHRMMAEMIYGADATGQHRKYAKAIFLGLCYGMGGAKLCRSLGLPTRMKYIEKFGKTVEVAGEEGQRLLDLFDQKVPFVRKLARKAEARAKKRGYVVTLLGRRCRFPTHHDGGYDWTHKALNRIIQGSSGDQVKRAMIDLDAAGHEPQLQVHDEVDGSFDDEGQAREAAAIMRDAVELRLPSRVDVETGASWGHSMENGDG